MSRQDQEPPLEVAELAANLVACVTEGIDAIPALRDELGDLRRQKEDLARQTGSVTSRFELLTSPLDIDPVLTQLEREALDAGDVGQFVLARTLRLSKKFPTASQSARELQVTAIQDALALAQGYQELDRHLVNSGEPTPVIRVKNVNFDDIDRPSHKPGAIHVGWLMPHAHILLAELEHTEDNYPEVGRSLKYPYLVVGPLVMKGYTVWDNLRDDEYFFRFIENQPPWENEMLPLLDPAPPDTIPGDGMLVEGKILGLHDSKSKSRLFVGQEQTDEFLDLVVPTTPEATRFRSEVRTALAGYRN